MAQARNVLKNKILAKLSHCARNPTRTPSIANAFHNQNIIYQRMKWSCTLAVALSNAHQQNYGQQLAAGIGWNDITSRCSLLDPDQEKKLFKHFSFAHSAPSRHRNSLELRLFVCLFRTSRCFATFGAILLNFRVPQWMLLAAAVEFTNKRYFLCMGPGPLFHSQWRKKTHPLHVKPTDRKE